jgi:hypothetical protein
MQFNAKTQTHTLEVGDTVRSWGAFYTVHKVTKAGIAHMAPSDDASGDLYWKCRATGYEDSNGYICFAGFGDNTTYIVDAK